MDQGYKVQSFKKDQVDITDFKKVKSIIHNGKPDLIFNYAATSSIAHNYAHDHIKTIVGGTFNILETCFKVKSKAKIFISGSAIQFCNCGLPIDKKTKLSHDSIYACARNSALFLSRYYRKNGLNVYFGFLFNHESAHRPKKHLTKILASKVYLSKRGRDPICLVDYNVKKEWSHAFDVCKKIVNVVQSSRPSEFIVGSGCSHSIKRFVFELSKRYGYSKKPILKNALFQKAQYKNLVSKPDMKSKVADGFYKVVNDLCEFELNRQKNK